LNNYFIDAACELVSQYSEESQNFEWKDDEAILDFALSEDLFSKIAEKAKKDANEVSEDMHS